MDLKRESTNAKDVLAVCIQKDGAVVGYMPSNLAPLVSFFSGETSQYWFGGDLNRGAGMGMKVPYIY